MNKHNEALNQINYLKGIIEASKVRCAPGYPYLLLWGLVWIAGYLGTTFFPWPGVKTLLWPVLAGVGVLLSALIGFRTARKATTPVPFLLKRLGLLGLILFLASSAMFSLLLHFHFTFGMGLKYINAYWPFQIGVIYLAVGIFMGREMLLIGAWLVLAASVSLLMPLVPQYVWLALAGGGGLILTGALLRRQVTRGD